MISCKNAILKKKLINYNKKIILRENSSFKFQPEVQLNERKYFREEPRHFSVYYCPGFNLFLLSKWIVSIEMICL